MLERNLYLFSSESLPFLQLSGNIRINTLDMVGLFALTLLIIKSFGEEKNISTPLKFLFLYLFFSVLFLSILSLIAEISLGDFGTRLRRYFYYIFIPATICIIKNKKDLKIFFYIIIFFGVLTCGLHFYENIFHKRVLIRESANKTYLDKDIKNKNSVFGSKRIFSRSSNTTLAAFLLSSSLLLLYKGASKWLHLATIAVTGISTFISMNRSNMLFLTSYLLAITIISAKQKGGRTVIHLLILFIVIGTFGVIGTSLFHDKSLFSSSFQRLTSLNITQDKRLKGTVNTYEQRKEQIQMFWKKALNSNFPFAPIFGIGIKTSSFWTADVGFINSLLDMGILGVVYILIFFIYLFWMGFRIMRFSQDQYLQAVGTGFFAGVFSMAITCFSRDWFTGNSFTFLLITVIILESINKIENNKIENKSTQITEGILSQSEGRI